MRTWMPIADLGIDFMISPTADAGCKSANFVRILSLNTSGENKSSPKIGFGLISIRENEEAAAVMGVNTTLYKVLAFALSGFFCALAGGIHAYWITFLDPVSAFDIGLNVKMIIMSVFGGPGSILGPVVGAVLLSGVSEILSTEISSLAGLFFGVVIVTAVVFMPRGLADLGRRYKKVGWHYFADNVRAHRL